VSAASYTSADVSYLAIAANHYLDGRNVRTYLMAGVTVL
jgi:hypothetical protein